MVIKRFFVFLLLSLLYQSCSTKKEVIYFQNLDNDSKINNLDFKGYDELLIKNDNILRIQIFSPNPEETIEFNKTNNYQTATNLDILKIEGYLVDNKGYINFPILGKVNVGGKSINQAQDVIYKALLDGGYLNNHTVEIKVLNSHFTILGEVNNPGKYFYLNNNVNILNAIGMAGDLTIKGKRSEIKLIREIEGKNSIYNIDLTSTNLFNSDIFQIYSGDIIIVNPNINRIKEAGIIGNSGTLISLLSFILTSIIVISN